MALRGAALKVKIIKLKHTRISTLLFTTPNTFLAEIWQKMVDNNDGLGSVSREVNIKDFLQVFQGSGIGKTLFPMGFGR